MQTEVPDPLLGAVLDEDATFRRTTLVQTVALARRRRRGRLMRRALSGVAVLALAGLLLRPGPTSPPSAPLAAAAVSPRVVRSTPLASSEIVRSRSGLFTTITNAPSNHAIVASEPGAVTQVETLASVRMLVYLSDQQLLTAFFPGEHPVLIAPGTPEARVVFAR